MGLSIPGSKLKEVGKIQAFLSLLWKNYLKTIGSLGGLNGTLYVQYITTYKVAFKL